jgi:hypothetical protein
VTDLDALAPVLEAYRTCEFTTLATDGSPLTWPTAVQARADGTLLVTTSLGFPQKAHNIRRDTRVALLFSDPTGSGLSDPPQVLIRGTAVCPEQIVVSPDGLERYWGMLFERQPSSRAFLAPPARWLMDWYYLRLLITITPTEIVTLPRFTPDTAPPAVNADHGLVGATTLARYPSAVLGALDTTGAPVLLRTRPVATPSGYLVEIPAGTGAAPGPASLLVHQHDDQLANLHNALVRGNLADSPAGWVLTPQRLVEPGNGNTVGEQLRTLRRARRSASNYLKHRELSRPKVRWDEFKLVADGVRH